MNERKITSFNLLEKTSELLDKIKEETGVSKSFVIEKAIEEYYKKYVKKEEE